jgi:phage-related minor tail protein
MNKAEEEAAKKREKIQQAYTKSALEAAKNVNEAYKSIRESGIKKVEDGMVDLIMGTKSVSESFKSMARSIIADLARLQIQRTITAPLSQALQSFTSGYLGTSTINTPDGATLYNPNLDTRATGGPVAKNTPYMVGERGPELFIPNGSGKIVKNSDLGSQGVTVVQNINVTTGVQQTVRTEIMGMMPQIATAAKGAVLDARRRGGSFAGAFG